MYSLVNDARIAWKCLNGVFVLYKPAGTSVKQVQSTLTAKLSKGNPLLKNNLIKALINKCHNFCIL